MKRTFLALALVIGAMTTAFTLGEGKIVSEKGHISFLSHTAIEDIKADNYKVKSSLDLSTGAIIIAAPMQSFKFENATMQKHFNSPKFLDTKQFPKTKMKGMITNLSEINFSKNGTYTAKVKGELTLHGVTKPINETATITVKDGKISMKNTMSITLADYNIAFKKGKPSTNVAKTIESTTMVEFTK